MRGSTTRTSKVAVLQKLIEYLVGENRIGFRPAAVRMLALTVRFPALLWLSGSLSIDEFGLFIVYQTSVAIFTFVIGLELHQVAIRNWVRATPPVAAAIKGRHLFVGLRLAGLAAVGLTAIYLAVLPGRPVEALLLGALCWTEYHQTENGRYLIAARRTLAANVLAFIRTAAWLPIGALLIELRSDLNLPILMTLWLLGNLLSMAISRRLREPSSAVPEDRRWLRTLPAELAKSSWFYAVVLSVLAREQADKLILAARLGTADVAAYGFFSMLANFALTIIQVTLVAENMRLFLQRDAAHRDALLKLAVRNIMLSLAISLAAGLVCYVLVDFVLAIIERPLFVAYKPVYLILLGGVAVQSVNNTLTLTLTALHRESAVAKIEVASGLLSLALNAALVGSYGPYACAWVIGGTAGLAALAKIVVAWQTPAATAMPQPERVDRP